MNLRVLSVLAGLGMLPAVASAQWSDNFDSYPSNTNINGLGGWQGWGNVPAQAPNTSTNQAFSPSNSVLVSGNGGTGGPGYSDNVHQYSGYNSGAWTYSAMTYVPGNTTGTAYFILTNQYADPSGPFNWSVECPINGTTGTITDDFRPGSATIIRDAWVPLRVDFDLTANTASIFYNNSLLSTGVWTAQAGGTLNLAAVDLYSDSSTGVYFDNLSLTRAPEPGAFALLALGGLVASRRRRA